MKFKFPMMLAILVLGASVLAGCAQDSTTPSNDNPRMQEEVAAEKSGAESTNPTRSEATGGTDGSTLKLMADPDGALKYDPTKLNAKAGNVTIALTNDSAVPHDVAVRDSSNKELGASEEITKSSTDLVLKDVSAGSYTFFCTVPGHEQAGMKGTLTVR